MEHLMTTDPMSVSVGTATTIQDGTGVLQDDVLNVGRVSRIATQTDLVSHFTEVSRQSADPRCSVVSSIPRY